MILPLSAITLWSLPLPTRKLSDIIQLDRLLPIVFLILSDEKLTVKQLAEELGVSICTIYRDIHILSIAGIPITSQKGYLLAGMLIVLKRSRHRTF